MAAGGRLLARDMIRDHDTMAMAQSHDANAHKKWMSALKRNAGNLE